MESLKFTVNKPTRQVSRHLENKRFRLLYRMRRSCLFAKRSSSVWIVHVMSCAEISSTARDWLRSLADSNTAEARKDES